ncbi:hypothetical protein LVD13_05890 [Flavobacteriaceae bacterium D16]|nr:hypothetical protein [Flavobacteriaceae bacterium D16]
MQDYLRDPLQSHLKIHTLQYLTALLYFISPRNSNYLQDYLRDPLQSHLKIHTLQYLTALLYFISPRNTKASFVFLWEIKYPATSVAGYVL